MKSNLKAILVVILTDLVLLNAFLAYLHFSKIGSGASHGWYLLNMCYLISAFVFLPRHQNRFLQWDSILSLAIKSLLLMLVIYSGYVIIERADRLRVDKVSVLYFCYTFIIIFSRVLSHAFLKIIRSNGHNTRTVVFLGAGHNLTYLHQCMMANPSTGYRFLGYFDTQKSDLLPPDVQYLGGLSQVLPWLRENPVEQLFCNLPQSRADEIMQVIRYCEQNFIRFYSVPNVRNYVHRAMEVEMMDDMPVLTLRREPLENVVNKAVKRLFDLVVSTLFLLFGFWWIALIVAVITKLTMPGPLFFVQKRNGLLGEEFPCIKFRSMAVNADADKLQATKGDSRVTRWGHLMRKTNIDELPQFINVFLGQMSVVGPRPHMVKHTQEYSSLIEKYMVRHWVKPGITGWAQVTGARGETQYLWQMEERIQKDIWYIEHWSLWLDIRIMVMTVVNAVKGDKQAY